MKDAAPWGLYIHIPFCRQKCGYCDFVSFAGREGQRTAYVDAVRQEIEQACRREGAPVFDTLFFGGGTPSLCEGDEIAAILDTARACGLRADAEVTLEANPGTLDEKKLRALAAAGVNRISLGAQAAQDELLRTLGRIHRWAEVEQAVEMARAAGIGNLSLDLMFGLPGQTPDMWQETLEKAAALSLEHISAYGLIIEEGTPFAAQKLVLPDDEAERAMYHSARAFWASCGLAHYEISNFARPGFECRHNLHYWRYDAYLGIGAAAHGFTGRERYANDASLEGYMQAVAEKRDPAVWHETVGEKEAYFEFIMMGLRLTGGVDTAAFERRFGVPFLSVYADAAKAGVQNGLIYWCAESLAPTERGLDLHNVALEPFVP